MIKSVNPYPDKDSAEYHSIRQMCNYYDSPFRYGFMIGWYIGHADGGEHDCRFFTPTAERAWESYVCWVTGKSIPELKEEGRL